MDIHPAANNTSLSASLCIVQCRGGVWVCDLYMYKLNGIYIYIYIYIYMYIYSLIQIQMPDE